MTGWSERRRELIAAYVAYAKRHPRKPTPTYQKVTLWVMVLVSLIAWVYMRLHR
jgi:hypothetical protein